MLLFWPAHVCIPSSHPYCFCLYMSMCMFEFMFMCVSVHVQCWSSSILFEFILCVDLWFCCSLPVGQAYRWLMCALSDQRLSSHLGLMSQPSGRAHISSEDTQACQALRVMWPSVLQADWLTAVVCGGSQLNVVCWGGVSVCKVIPWEQDVWKLYQQLEKW